MKTKVLYPRMSVIIPLSLFAFGVIATFDEFIHGPTAMILPLPPAWLLFLGPPSIVVGFVTFFRGFAWGARALSRRTVLIVGLLMLVCPSCYVFSLPRNFEGLGSLWLIMLLFVSFPGCILMLLALAMKPTRRNKFKGGRGSSANFAKGREFFGRDRNSERPTPN